MIAKQSFTAKNVKGDQVSILSGEEIGVAPDQGDQGNKCLGIILLSGEWTPNMELTPEKEPRLVELPKDRLELKIVYYNINVMSSWSPVHVTIRGGGKRQSPYFMSASSLSLHQKVMCFCEPTVVMRFCEGSRLASIFAASICANIISIDI